ncbi:MAG: NDP-sugar synthase [Blastocatellia bacterium]|nr:NDP-sugar synthase [Blastocatellia bacterium]
MHAMILAAGFGTRLWPLTIDRTKPAIPVLNRPLITYSVDYLRKFGIRDVVVNLHHQGESVATALGDGSQFDCHLTYSHEADQILGTSGALDHARAYLEHGSFVVMNGKVITSIDLAAAIETHRRHQALATLVLQPNTNRERFSMVEVDSHSRITRFAGFPTAQETGECLMFTGIQILEPEIFNFIPRGVFSHSTTDVYPKAIAAGRPVVAHIARGPNEHWYEFSTLRRYLDLSLFLRGQSLESVIGDGCRIAPDAKVVDSVLWERVHVSAGVTLQRVIVGDDVMIPPGTNLENAVVVRADKLPSGQVPERGQIIGENLVVEI